MIPTLWPDQELDLNRVRASMREHRAVVLVRPCGSGKGTIASYVVHSAESRGKRVIFAVDRRVLVHDMSMRLDRLGIDHGVIMGDDKRRKPWLGTHVASIDTLTRRDVLPVADLIIIDETHKAVAPKWKKVLDRYPQAKILGLTATPIRLDGRGLEEIYDDMVVGPSVEDLLKLKLIVPSVVFAPPRQINTSKVKKTGGDYNSAALAHVCDNAKLVGDIVAHWQRHASDRKTAFFGVDCKHARNTAEQFRCAGVETAYVDADTPDDERQRIWDDFDRGTCRIICSVGVIGIGWDHSVCSCIIDGCPTLSIERFLQRIGRGSRTHPIPITPTLQIIRHVPRSKSSQILCRSSSGVCASAHAVSTPAQRNCSAVLRACLQSTPKNAILCGRRRALASGPCCRPLSRGYLGPFSLLVVAAGLLDLARVGVEALQNTTLGTISFSLSKSSTEGPTSMSS